MLSSTSQSDELAEVKLTFRAMNTSVEVLIYVAADKVDQATAACRQIEILFAHTEATLSRFRPQSELSRLNRQGYIENASELLFTNLAAACEAFEFTGGIFDPTILEALELAGYDRSFELVSKNTPHLFVPHSIINSQKWKPLKAQIELDPARRFIRLEPGLRIDLGGIAKGSSVDRASQLLDKAGLSAYMISAGGDMYLRGCPPQNKSGWQVTVANEALDATENLTNLSVSNKAVATSSTTGRRWSVGGKNRHHLIDPRTRQPSNNGLAAVTVIANSVQIADVMAKTALIMGPTQTLQTNLKQRAGLTTILFVTLDGQLSEQ